VFSAFRHTFSIAPCLKELEKERKYRAITSGNGCVRDEQYYGCFKIMSTVSGFAELILLCRRSEAGHRFKWFSVVLLETSCTSPN